MRASFFLSSALPLGSVICFMFYVLFLLWSTLWSWMNYHVSIVIVKIRVHALNIFFLFHFLCLYGSIDNYLYLCLVLKNKLLNLFQFVCTIYNWRVHPCIVRGFLSTPTALSRRRPFSTRTVDRIWIANILVASNCSSSFSLVGQQSVNSFSLNM